MVQENLRNLRFIGINSPPTAEIKTELPGNDPTPLYFAMLQFAEDRAKVFGTVHSPEERNLGKYIFNPKIWNEATRSRWVEKIIDERPHVALITNTSPSHPYALRIADTVREYSPNTIVIIGGPHEDETMRTSRFDLLLIPGSTLLDMKEGRISRAIDFVFSGDGDHAVTAFMQLIGGIISSSPEASHSEIKQAIIERVRKNPELFTSLPGQGVLATLDDDDNIISVSLSGSRIDLGNLPFIYRYFPNLSKFDVFKNPDGSLKKTAHLMTSRGCPDTCLFCSESIKVIGKLARIQGTQDKRIGRIVGHISEAIWYGSEAAFFEDSIFLFGNKNDILTFSSLFARVKQTAAELLLRGNLSDRRRSYLQRIVGFEWGCQFTVENILLWKTGEEDILRSMKEAGCSYIFFGIESLAEEVMVQVQKHRTRNPADVYNLWSQKVRKALLLAKQAGLNVGASVLFGLPGETRETIDHTIDGISSLIQDQLLDLVSPNLTTYHPGTAFTQQDGMADKINYIDIVVSRPPYSFFEEADPGRISRLLSEADVWYIWNRIDRAWKVLNHNQTEVML